jgi:hypothetical protein
LLVIAKGLCYSFRSIGQYFPCTVEKGLHLFHVRSDLDALFTRAVLPSIHDKKLSDA